MMTEFEIFKNSFSELEEDPMDISIPSEAGIGDNESLNIESNTLSFTA